MLILEFMINITVAIQSVT